MNNPNALTWSAFKAELTRHPDLNLQFQFAEGAWVKPSYHITEIKQAPITSVDCGGKKNSWTEIIVQLWEPEEKQQERSMKARKAMSIVELVEKSIPLDPAAEVKIEFGNSKFDTRQMFPAEITAQGEDLIIDLRTDTVQCKALGRNESCGPQGTKDESKTEPKIVETAGCCTPGSGCC